MNRENIASIASFVSDATSTVSRLEADNAALVQKVASLEEHQKIASEVQTPAISTERAATAVSQIIQAGFLKEASRNKAVAAISADPVAGLNFLEKLAQDTINKKSLPRLGNAVKLDKQASVSQDSVKASDLAFAKHFGSGKVN